MILPRVVLAGDVGGLDTTRKAYIATTLRVLSRYVRFASPATVGKATYSAGRRLSQICVRLAVSGGTKIDMVITHGCKNLEEKKDEVASRDDQKVDGGVLADLDEKARRTASTGKTSIMTFRGIHDDNQGQDVFGTEGIGCLGMD